MITNRAKLVLCILVCACAALGAMSGRDDTHDDASRIQSALKRLAEEQYPQAERMALSLAMGSRHKAPNNRAWLIVASARQRSGRYTQALRAYRMFLGLCTSADLRDYVLEQMETCRRSLQKPDPEKTRLGELTARQLRRLARTQSEVHTESSEHFVVRAWNPELARLIAERAERALSRICGVILAGQEYPHKVDIYVWTDRREYLSHARDAPEWSGANFSFRQELDGVVRRIDLTQKNKSGKFDPVMLDRVLPHEMCHLVLREYFGDSPCPLFLEEGLAMMAESQIDNERLVLAGTVLNGEDGIPLARLATTGRADITDPSVFYAEALSFTEYLHNKLTRRQFRQFLQHVRDGCTVTDAIQRALYVPHKEQFAGALAAAWKEHAVTNAQYLRALYASAK